MEDHEWEWITKNQSKLLRHTVVNTTLLAELRTILHKEDIETIKCQETPTAQCQKLYDLLKSRKDGYSALKKALSETKQTKALHILEQCPRTPNNIQLSQQPPSFQPTYQNRSLFSRVFANVPPIPASYTGDTTNSALLLHDVDFLEIPAWTKSYDTIFVFCRTFTIPDLLNDCTNTPPSVILVTRQDISDEVKNRLPSSCTIHSGTLLWTDLTPQIQTNLLERRIKLFPNRKSLSLSQALAKFCSEENKPEFFEAIDETLLIDIINDKKPSLFVADLPNKAPTYVRRTLSSRHRISVDLHKNTKSLGDIFLYTGETESSDFAKQLPDGAKTNRENSSRLRETGTISVRHIILDEPQFEDIYSQGTVPVHWLHYERRGFIWKWSRGSLQTIQANICTKYQDTYENEDEFLRHIKDNQTLFKSAHIIISTEPGMGKSELLRKIGKVLESGSNRLVIHSEMLTFISRIETELSAAAAGDLTISIVKVLSDMASDYDFGKRLFRFGLENGIFHVYLLLDSYHELPKGKVRLADQCLETIRVVFKHISVFVTTRPQKLEKLENKMQAMGYKICPLNATELVQFFTTFWKDAAAKSGELVDPQKLVDYGDAIIAAIGNSQSNKIQCFDLINSPLPCLVFAKYFRNDAISHARQLPAPGERHKPVVNFKMIVSCLLEVCEELIAVKLKKYVSTDNPDELEPYKLQHAEVAIRKIFRRFPVQPKTSSNNRKVSEGFLQFGVATPTTAEPSHPILGEYLIAWYVAERIPNIRWNNAQIIAFLRGAVFTTVGAQIEQLSSPGRPFKTSTFRRKYMCHFLNAIIRKKTKVNLELQEAISKTLTDPEKKTILEACVHDDLDSIFNYLTTRMRPSNEVFTEEIVLLATVTASAALFRKVIVSYKASGQTLQQISYHLDHPHFEEKHPILCLAVRRGNYSIVKRLLNDDIFRTTVASGMVPTLVHLLVENTKNENPSQIEDRVKILTVLAQISNRRLLFAEDWIKRTPTFCRDIHFQLLLEMVGLRAPCSSRETSVLHCEAKSLTIEEYSTLITKTPDDILKDIVHHKNSHKRTPLQQYMLRIMYSSSGKYHFENIHRMVSHGAEWKQATSDGFTLIQLAARKGLNGLLVYLASNANQKEETSVCTNGNNQLHQESLRCQGSSLD